MATSCPVVAPAGAMAGATRRRESACAS